MNYEYYILYAHSMRGPSIDGPVDLLINIKPMDQQFGSNRYTP